MRWQKGPVSFSNGVSDSEGVKEHKKWALAQSCKHKALAAA